MSTDDSGAGSGKADGFAVDIPEGGTVETKEGVDVRMFPPCIRITVSLYLENLDGSAPAASVSGDPCNNGSTESEPGSLGIYPAP